MRRSRSITVSIGARALAVLVLDHRARRPPTGSSSTSVAEPLREAVLVGQGLPDLLRGRPGELVSRSTSRCSSSSVIGASSAHCATHWLHYASVLYNPQPLRLHSCKKEPADAAGPDGRRAVRPRRALLRHLLAACSSERVIFLGAGDRRPGREPDRRPDHPPRVRGPRQGHQPLHQLARRPVYAGLAIYDAMQFVKPDVRTICYGDRRCRWASLLLAGGAEGKRMALPNSPHPHPPAQRRLRGPVAADIEIHARETLDAPRPARRDLRQAHRPVEEAGPRGHGARPLLQGGRGRRVRPDRPRDRAARAAERKTGFSANGSG